MADVRRFMKNGDYYYFGDAPQHISGVNLDKSDINLSTVGQTSTLLATIVPTDTVEDVTLNWSSSDTSIATVAPYVPRLPSEYQEVEYIESSGTQYIDTGVSAPNGFKAIFGVTAVESASASRTVVGSHNISSPYGRNNVNMFTSGNTWGLHMNDEMINGLGSIVIGAKYKVECSTILGASYLKVDGVNLTNGSNTSPMSSNNVLIFANQYEINAGTTFIKAKIYYCKIYDNSETLVRDFVPCYRKADDVIGLYDLVNDVFYTNSGSGDFTKGYDINPDAIVTCVTPGECTITVTTTPGGYTATCDVTYPKWVLYKETDFHNSSYGGFRTAGWYNSASPSYTGFNTTDGYIYSTGNHSRCKICPDTSDLALFQSAKAIKIVTDGFMVGNNTNRYNSWVGLGGWWQEYGKKSSGMNYPTLLSGTALTYGVWYKSETILTKEDSLITTLDNGSSYGITYSSGLWNQLVSTSANSYFYPSASDGLMCLAEVALDNGTTSYLKDVHVYLLF